MEPTDAAARLLAGRYRLGALLGRGGMAEVFDAFDERLSRPVAVKVLRAGLPDPEGMRVRFSREARAAAGLSHPSVVAVYDSGEDGGRAFMVMERLSGETLADRMRRGPLDPRWVATVGADVVAALGAAHAMGLVHRDIKPANILITDGGRAKVADFGITKAYGAGTGAAEADLTATGMILGTVAYLAPEQVDGAAATPRSDIYSLGVVLYEALAGRKPYVGDGPVAQARAAHEGNATDLARLRPDVPAPLAAVVRRAMARDPAARYPSAAAMAADLAATGLVGPTPGGVDPTAMIGVGDATVPTRRPADPTTVLAAARTGPRPLPGGPTGAGRGAADGTPERGRRALVAAVVVVALAVVVAAVVAIVVATRHRGTTSSTTVATTVPRPTTTVRTTATTAAATTTLDPQATALLAEAAALQADGGSGPLAVAIGLRSVAATAPGSAQRAATATAVLANAAVLAAQGGLSGAQYAAVAGLLEGSGATPPSTTTTPAPTTTVTTPATTAAPTTTAASTTTVAATSTTTSAGG